VLRAGIHSVDDFLMDVVFMAACCLMAVSCMMNVLSGTLGFFLSRWLAVLYCPSTVVFDTTAGNRTPKCKEHTKNIPYT